MHNSLGRIDRRWRLVGVMVMMAMVCMSSMVMVMMVRCGSGWLCAVRDGWETKRTETACSVVVMLFMVMVVMMMPVCMLMVVVMTVCMIRFASLATFLSSSRRVPSIKTLVVIIRSTVLVLRDGSIWTVISFRRLHRLGRVVESRWTHMRWC